MKPQFDIIENLQNQNRFLKESRDILLPRLMNGSLSVEKSAEQFPLAAEPEVEYLTK